MYFATLDFLLFIVPVLAGYWMLSNHPMVRGLWLIGASYFFYMAGSRPPDGSLPTAWYYVGLLAFSTVLNYVAAARIDRLAAARGDASESSRRRAQQGRALWLGAALAGNLGLLAYFKYTNFAIEAFCDVANALGADLIAPQLQLLMPIGISFYTFQSLSYTIDVWRGSLRPEPSFRKFVLFVAFFPQLVAGPIVRASEFLPQLHRRPRLSRQAVGEALFRITKGMFKKVVFGDWIPVVFSDLVFTAPENYTSLEHLLALYAFTLQIYGDFSGYSDIAIGVAKLMGFDMPENFDRPYQARGVGEFWRRWHMTLSTWLRDYLFFPLGGSRKSPARTYFNLWLTMFLVGMWHRASWNFIIYSNVHAFAMLFNRWNTRRRAAHRAVGLGAFAGGLVLGGISYGLGVGVLELSSRGAAVLTWIVLAGAAGSVFVPEDARRWSTAVHILLTFHFTVLSRVFFQAADLDTARIITQRLVDWDGRGFRPGLFRVESWRSFFDHPPLDLPEIIVSTGQWCAEHGVLLVLIAGLGYHFTPRSWVDDHLGRRFAALPGPVIGVILALLGALLVDLLDGPRANIYFAF
ncbi:MAG: MBOAT family protein [Myxococcales bacterium FL481]|nr:MAG: MBOAT family protein [Myxococcales bacterium FL481]